MLKSDQEESIKALKRAIPVKRQAETIMIESLMMAGEPKLLARRKFERILAQDLKKTVKMPKGSGN